MTQLPTEPDTEAMADGFRSMMARFPTGVAIVTTLGPGRQPKGMTCSSVCSVTLTPPTLLVCLRRGSPTLEAILRQETFAVNLLHGAAQATAELFASGKPDRFDQVHWRAGPEDAGPWLLDDAHTVAHCALAKTDEVGDHAVVFGAVFGLWQGHQRPPLLYGLHRYAPWPFAPTTKE